MELQQSNNEDPFSCIASPLHILIKDEIHEPITFDFTDETNTQQVMMNQPLGHNHPNIVNTLSDSNDSLEECITNPIEDTDINQKLPSAAVLPQSLTKSYNFRSKSSKAIAAAAASNLSAEFNCTLCAITLKNREQFDIHQSGHTNNLRCQLCTTILKNFRNYEKHVGKCKPFQCNVCGKTIRFRPNFIKHMRIHNPKNVPTASSLGASTSETIEKPLTGSSSSSKKVPKADRHRYKCATCDKEFTSWEYFKVHQKIHVDDVNLKCDICDRTFSALACLRGHQKVHTGERPFR